MKKIIHRSETPSPMKVGCDQQISTTILMANPVVDLDDTLCVISYDRETELNRSIATTSSLSTSMLCNDMQTRVKALQKTISWYKRQRLYRKKKVQKVEAGNINTSLPLSVYTVVDKEDSNDDNGKESFDHKSSMDYSSFEESSQSAAEVNKDIMWSTFR